MKKTALLLVILTFLALAPVFDYRVAFFYYMMFWVVMASSLNLIFGLTGYLPFGYVVFYGIGSYATAFAWSTFGVNIFMAILFGGLSAAIMAMLFSPTLRLKGVYFAIVNSSCALTVKTIISSMPDEWLGGSAGYNLSKIYDPETAYYAMLLLMIVTLYIAYHITRSRLGIALKSIKQDRTAAEVLGIDTVRARLRIWIIAAFLPGLAGGLDAWYTSVVDPETAFSMLITAKSVLYGMFGGFSTVTGPVLGAVSMYTLDDVIWGLFPMFDAFLIGLVMLLLILYLPKGLVGELLYKYPKFRQDLR
ncbi:MAG: branched-chain amino acid ABC transporter permease [Acidaminococcales bacterium]|jgi:branched-chain amino acid transport system permease protein|nr:branched-chain amino acid ABC transporter permease [Acidaminococcales bacterium]